MAGTIRSCQKFLIAHNREQLRLMTAAALTPETRSRIAKMLASVTVS